MTNSPFLSDWNFQILKRLFLLFPHDAARDAVAQFFVTNSLASSWIYAVVFYVYWRIEDNQTTWRRNRLILTFTAFCLATLTTLALRPWVGWPAPTLVPRFQQLYPQSLWFTGNPNCFPSHSTLAYLLVAVGFWQFRRWVSLVLIIWGFLLISLPRVYIGGHYPIDIVVAVLWVAVAEWGTRMISVRCRPLKSLMYTTPNGLAVEVFLFLWLFELGDGFRSSYWILRDLFRAAQRIYH